MLRRNFLQGAVGLTVSSFANPVQSAIVNTAPSSLDLPYWQSRFRKNVALILGLSQDSLDEAIRNNVSKPMPVQSFSGSAILLDNAGTVALCNHEICPHTLYLAYFLCNDGEKPAMTQLHPLEGNTAQDIAFATIPSSFVAEKGLSPIEWGESYTSKDQQKNRPMMLFGFPNQKMSITEAFAYNYDPSLTVQDTQISCSITAQVFMDRGTSGGAAFDDNGKLIGMVRDANLKDGSTSFMPVETLRDSYLGLGLSPDSEKAPKLPWSWIRNHRECRYNPTQFQAYKLN